jgi:hypothetical protein
LCAAFQALEKYLMTKLYDRTFAATPEEVERDQILSVRMTALQFVQPEHLEIPASLMDEASLSVAVTELNKINGYKVRFCWNLLLKSYRKRWQHSCVL